MVAVKNFKIEWPTWVLIGAIYGTWAFGLTMYHTGWHGAALVILLLSSAWQMSLQHELLHGHPTRHQAINHCLGLPPLAVWFPYTVYRQSHLAHHDNENITVPGVDTESYFVTWAQWQTMNMAERILRTFNMTFIGRMTVGPAMNIWALYKSEIRAIANGDRDKLKIWLLHLLLVMLMLYGLWQIGLAPLLYLAIAYGATSVAMIRSFYEHRPSTDIEGRTVINEAGWFWRLLFLNNNFHFVHHEFPRAPWYMLPALYRRDRDAYLQRNGGFLVRGYSQWMLRHAWKPVAKPYLGQGSS